MREAYSLILLLGLQSAYRVQAATKTWATLPIRQPPVINDTARFLPNTDGSLGTPPQNITMLVDIGSQPLFAITPDCLFCPSEGMYDPSYSSSSKIANASVSYGNLDLGGFRGNETLTLGGILQDPSSPLVFINQMTTNWVPRFSGGHLGLFVPKNASRRAASPLARLDDQGQLLNPVWGLRLGGENPQLTIGALDPNDYEGEINWVPAVDDGPVIQVDAWKGYQGNVIPANYPINVSIDSMSKNIYLPELDVFMMNESLIGPQDTINIYPPRNVTFGVNYPVNQKDLVRTNNLAMSAPGVCNVGIMESSTGSYVLGVTFLRSVYLAYRFPTASCPAYWGFATPKGVSLPSSSKNQKPKATPTDAATCLSLVTPTSTPVPTIKPNGGSLLPGSTGEKYAVYGQPNLPQVELRGVADLPPLKAAGAIYGLGN